MSELALDLFNAISEIVKLRKRIAELEKQVDAYANSNGLRNKILQDIVDKQHTRIAELEEKQRWIPVSERLPEFGTSILFYDSILERTNKGTCTALNRDKTNLQWLTDDGIYYHGNRCEYITHWKEEPARPEAQQ